MGQWPRVQGTDFMHVQLHMHLPLIKWKQQSADLTQRDAGRRSSPTVFSSQRPHQTKISITPTPTPHPAFPKPVASAVTANHRKPREQRKAWCSATFQESMETPLRFSLHQCWWQMKKGRGDWSTLQPHIPFTNVCLQYQPGPFTPLCKNCRNVIIGDTIHFDFWTEMWFSSTWGEACTPLKYSWFQKK